MHLSVLYMQGASGAKHATTNLLMSGMALNVITSLEHIALLNKLHNTHSKNVRKYDFLFPLTTVSKPQSNSRHRKPHDMAPTDYSSNRFTLPLLLCMGTA